MTVKGEENGEYNWCDIVRRPEQKSLFFRSFPFWSSVSMLSFVEQWTVSPWIRYVKCSGILAYFSSSSFLKYFPCFLSHKLHLNLFGSDIFYWFIACYIRHIFIICMLHSFLQIVRERKKKTKCQRKYQRVKEGEIFEHSRTFTVDWKRFRFENVTDLLWGEYYEIKQHLSKRLKKTSKVSVCNNHFSTSWWKLLYVFPIDVTRNEHLKQETRKKCQPRKERKIGGRSATVPHHTRLL